MLIVGLTGNYGMGKSTVLALFKEIGAVTISSDKIVSELLKEKDVIDKVRSLFGDIVINKDGTLNKERIADIIFKNSSLRYILEDILHSLVFKKIDEYIQKIREKNAIVIVEIPLVFERGYENKFDKIITVYTDEEVTIKRLELKGVDRNKAIMRLKTQMPIIEKIKRSDFLIDNNGTIEQTRKQIQNIYLRLKTLEDSNIGNN